MTDLRHLRQDFPVLQRTVNGKPLAFLDSAASTQKPVQVLDAMNDLYRNHYANVHRGAYQLSIKSTAAYEAARVRVADFIKAPSPDELVFTKGTTASINHVAYGWGLDNLGEGDRILLTKIEHHANIVPWQIIARHTGAELIYLDIDDDFQIDISSLDEVLDERVKVVGVTAMSNVTGTIGPVRALADAAHQVGAIVVVDGAQAVPHSVVDVAEMGADFVAFGAHKMLGPTGIGALWGRRELLERMEPAEGGGEMITDVRLHESTWAPIPQKFEAGTPPIAEAVGFGAAVEYLQKVGMDVVREHEVDLTRYALGQLGDIPDLTVYGPADPENRGGAISFTLADIHAHDLATILDQEGVAVRAGHHCAKPFMRHLGIPATARASFYVYTVREEIDQLIGALHHARKVFDVA
ncbi:MAG: cysteine desulfurase [Acidimicrobiia bacterium]|nr:cysteine desulfurase [Acidimicrobiia bacterium]